MSKAAEVRGSVVGQAWAVKEARPTHRRIGAEQAVVGVVEIREGVLVGGQVGVLVVKVVVALQGTAMIGHGYTRGRAGGRRWVIDQWVDSVA